MTDLPFAPLPDGVTVAVRLTPKASRDAVQGLAVDADGAPVLKATVTAVPEGGKANTALVALLAKAWRVPKSSITLLSGATDRRKRLLVAGDPDALMTALAAWARDLERR